MVKKVFAQIYIWLILLLMYLPILVLIAFSFTTATNVGEWTGFTFELYPALFQNEEIMRALGNTVIIALLSGVISTLLGASGAIGVYYFRRRRWKKTLDFVNQIGIVNSEIVIALSLTVMFVFLGTYIFRTNIFSFWTLLIGHCVLGVPFVYTSVQPRLKQMDPSLYEAAIDLGAKPRQAMTRVVIPELIPGILSGFLLAVTLSLDDFIVTTFTRGSGLLSGANSIETLSTLIQAKIKKGPIPTEMRALTTLIFVLVIAIVIGVTIYRNIKAKKKAQQKGVMSR